VCRRSIVTARLILDRTLSYREHLTKTAVKLKNQNANTLRSFALALCYSTVLRPVWSRSTHTCQVDVQLNSTMRLISDKLRSAPLPWLPVLSNIKPPAVRRKAATDKLVEKNCQTRQLANPACYPQPTIATIDIQEAAVAGLATN